MTKETPRVGTADELQARLGAMLAWTENLTVKTARAEPFGYGEQPARHRVQFWHAVAGRMIYHALIKEGGEPEAAVYGTLDEIAEAAESGEQPLNEGGRRMCKTILSASVPVLEFFQGEVRMVKVSSDEKAQEMADFLRGSPPAGRA